MLLFNLGADVRKGCGQDSPLHAAVYGGEPDIVDLLLDYGADGSCRNADGKTPLDISEPNSSVRTKLQTKGILNMCVKYKGCNFFIYLFSKD